MVLRYQPSPVDSWTRLNISLPTNIEFSTALATETHIYLTSAHAHELYRYVGNVGKENKEIIRVFLFQI